jgi:probable rRNA maturation factor
LSLELAVQFAVPRRGVPATASFRQWALAALAGDRRRGAYEIALKLVEADEGRALNRDFRGRDYATNVLSFPPAEVPGVRPPHGLPRHLGDLVICAPVVLSEADAQQKPVRDHFAHLTVHGVLHLLGHDHLEDAEATRMEALETRVLAGLGIADPYRER